jgi:hypothetical protein
VTAAEPKLGWDSGAFMTAYHANRSDANARVLDDDPVASVVTDLSNRGGWSGTASDLLHTFDPYELHGVPRAANQLTRRLRELKPNLTRAGIHLEFRREGKDSRRMVYIGPRTVRTDRSDRAA